MSLDEVEVANLALDAIEDAQARAEKRGAR